MIQGQSKRDKPITTLRSFIRKIREDSTSFLKNLVIDVEANSWDETDLLKVIKGFLKDNAKKQYIDNQHQFQHWDEITDQRHSFVPKFVVQFKTKTQVEVWYHKWDVLKYEKEKDMFEYATRFKKIYKRINPQKRTSIRMIIQKFINSLPPKYVELLTIIRSANLDEAIKAALDVKASQRVKTRKRNQTYMVDTIEELRREVHNLQVSQAKSK